MLYISIMHTILLHIYHHIYGFSMFNTLTKALHVIVSILQVISSFFVINKPLEIPLFFHSASCKKRVRPPKKARMKKRCEIQGSSQEMAVMVG